MVLYEEERIKVKIGEDFVLHHIFSVFHIGLFGVFT